MPKAGTTSLFQGLASHSEICGSDVKEAQYFRPLLEGQEPGPVDDYRRHFRHCGGERYRLEASPEYFYGGESVVRAMRSLLPGLKAILLLREPTSRLVSFYRFKKAHFALPAELDIESYVAACDRVPEQERLARSNSPFMGIEGGFFDRYVDAWLRAFGDDLKILFFDDLIADPRQVLEKLADWLSLDADGFPNSSFGRQNESASFRWAPAQRLALSVAARAERLRLNRSPLYSTARSAYFRVNGRQQTESLDRDAADKLRARFLPHNARLAERLSRAGYSSLPAWLEEG